jgi:hypothetical protein
MKSCNIEEKYLQIADLERLTHESIGGMQTSSWLECVKCREILPGKAFQRGAVRDSVLETITVNSKESCSKNSEFSSENKDHAE